MDSSLTGRRASHRVQSGGVSGATDSICGGAAMCRPGGRRSASESKPRPRVCTAQEWRDPQPLARWNSNRGVGGRLTPTHSHSDGSASGTFRLFRKRRRDSPSARWSVTRTAETRTQVRIHIDLRHNRRPQASAFSPVRTTYACCRWPGARSPVELCASHWSQSKERELL